MRVVFLGNCADYSLGFLTALVERSRDPADRVSLQAVVCPMRFESRPEALWFEAKRRLGRVAARIPAGVAGRVGIPKPGLWHAIDQAAAAAGAMMLWPESPSDPLHCRRIAALGADVGIVAGLDRILKGPALASFPPLYNIHPSPLPEYRGATPEFWQVDAGTSEGGVTVHRVEAGIDSGPIVLQRRFAIEPWLDADSLLARCMSVGVELLHEFLDGYPGIAERATPQQGGSSQPTASARDRQVPFERAAGDVFNRARAAGWSAPLAIYVARDTWNQGGVTQGLSSPDATPGDVLLLQLFEPVPFPAYTQGPPGLLLRVDGGGVALTCNPGTVFFRRVEPLAFRRAPSRLA